MIQPWQAPSQDMEVAAVLRQKLQSMTDANASGYYVGAQRQSMS